MIGISKPMTTLLEAAENKGLAAGLNIGIKHALKHHDPDYLWLLNNDSEVALDSLEALLHSVDKHPDRRIWGSTIYDLEDRNKLQCAGGFRYYPMLSIPVPLKPVALPDAVYHPAPKMDYVSGISMFIPAGCFERFGSLDESYFLYYEELELVRQFGGKKYIAWCPASKIFHKGGGSTGGADPNRGKGSWAAHYYGNLSALKYTARYHPWYLPLVWIFRLIAKSILFFKYGDWRGFRPMLKAFWDFSFGSTKC